MKSNKKNPISLQNWDILRFCAHPIPAPSSPLTSIWSAGTEFLLDQLQHFVIFLLREKKLKKKRKESKKKEKRRRLAHLISVSACHCTLFRGISWIFSPQKKALPQELSQSTNPRPCFNTHALDLLPDSLILQSCGISVIGVEGELQQSLPPSPHPTNISHMEQRQQTPGIQGISGMNPQGFAPPFPSEPTPSQPLIRRNARNVVKFNLKSRQNSIFYLFSLHINEWKSHLFGPRVHHSSNGFATGFFQAFPEILCGRKGSDSGLPEP